MNEIGLVIGIVAFVVGLVFYVLSRRAIRPDEASRIVKELAEQQKVELRISPEQMEAIRSQWIRDPNRPAQLTFLVDGEPVGEMKVATCPYWSDTCCA